MDTKIGNNEVSQKYHELRRWYYNETKDKIESILKFVKRSNCGHGKDQKIYYDSGRHFWKFIDNNRILYAFYAEGGSPDFGEDYDNDDMYNWQWILYDITNPNSKIMPTKNPDIKVGAKVRIILNKEASRYSKAIYTIYEAYDGNKYKLINEDGYTIQYQIKYSDLKLCI
jgi:hypothetical protein